MKIGKIPLDSKVTLTVKGYGKEVLFDVTPASMGKVEEALRIELIKNNGVVLKFGGNDIRCSAEVVTPDGRDYSYSCKAVIRETVDGEEYHTVYSDDNPKEVNRRDCARFPFVIPVDVNYGGASANVRAFTKDISYEGLCLRIPNTVKEVPVDTVLRASFEYKGLRYKAIGNIKRSYVTESTLELGVQFTKECAKTLSELVAGIAREEVKKARKVRGLNGQE